MVFKLRLKPVLISKEYILQARKSRVRCVRNKTVDIDIFVISGDGSRKILHNIKYQVELLREKEKGTD